MFFNKIIDFIIPPRCVCARIVSQDELLCYECWSKLEPVVYFCPSCGVPYTIAIDDVCSQCLHTAIDPKALKGRSAFFYNDFSKDWLMRLKYGDQTHMAKKMGHWMAACDPEFFKDTDLLMPVPLHFWRLLRRRYNQSGLIANHIGCTWGMPVCHTALIKKRYSDSQGQKTKEERAENVKDTFQVNPAIDIKGKKITLIDDVLTTGATLQACADVLYAHGASSIKYLTFAYQNKI